MNSETNPFLTDKIKKRDSALGKCGAISVLLLYPSFLLAFGRRFLVDKSFCKIPAEPATFWTPETTMFWSTDMDVTVIS